MLRCKAGDLALVIHDEDSCADNIGKVVRVGGPVNVNWHYRVPCWLIEPVKPEPWLVLSGRDCKPRSKVIGFADRVDHPDAWLLPLRPPRPERRDKRRKQHKPETRGASFVARKPSIEVEVPEEQL